VEPIDLYDENKIPVLARRLFDRYDFDALPFIIENCLKSIQLLHQLYPTMSPDGLDKAQKILTLEVVVKFCHLAENFAAFAIAFKKRYENEKDEILGISKTIANYEIAQVVDFYKHIRGRDLKYIAQFIGYPSLSLQSANTRTFIETSCQNVKSDVIEIADLYDNLRLLYDAYKHGYRIAFAENEVGADAFTFIINEGNPGYVLIGKKYFDLIQRRAKSCYELFKLTLALHKERVGYEKRGSVQKAPLRVYLYPKPNDPKPNEEVEFMYPSRGAISEALRKEGDMVYALFSDDLENNHRGKIVAIDIDEKKLVAYDYDFNKVIQIINSSNSTNRHFIRRASKDGRLPVVVY
jgi:hypothetical protein